MASKKKAADTTVTQSFEDLRRINTDFTSAFDERKFFIQDLARQILLTISSKRSNGAPVRGDEKAAVESATELANLLGVK